MKISTEGAFWKFLQLATPVVYLITSTILWRAFDTLDQHKQRITVIEEWKKGHAEVSTSALERLSTLERSNNDKSVELAILKEKLGGVVDNTTKTAANISMLNDQFVRLQQLMAEIREKIVGLQVQMDAMKEAK